MIVPLCLMVMTGSTYAQDKLLIPDHPRGLILGSDTSFLREKITREPFQSMFESLILEEKQLSGKKTNIYESAKRISFQAYLYLLTGEKEWAEKCYLNIESLSTDTIFVRNPLSKGLTRAYVLREFALAYDFCFNAWTKEQRQRVNDQTFQLMVSVNNNMGKMANYHLESNWMGVRYGSVVFAANVIDDKLLSNDHGKMKRAYLWDAKERLRDHLYAAFTPNGWFSETLGYHEYDGSFIHPAIIALQNTSSFHPVFDLENYAPQLIHSLYQHITSVVNLPNQRSVGLKADLGDDNPMMGLSLFAHGMRLMPDSQKPYLKWMANYLSTSTDNSGNAILIVLCPEVDEAVNPSKGGFLNYVDETQGITFFRNRFKDKNDIVSCFNTSSHRISGHSGPDNLTFRIIGLGSLWAVGAGRTGEVAGQTNLFPGGNWQEQREKKVEGKLVDYHFESDGSGYAIGTGSCLGVRNHQRTFKVDYSGKSGAEAVFVVEDQSDNGKTWRLNTPEFNEIEILPNGFLLKAPNGSTLKAIVEGKKKVSIKTGKVRYGGSTVANNTGIGFEGKKYWYNKTIDIACERNIKVVMTLQPKGVAHPDD